MRERDKKRLKKKEKEESIAKEKIFLCMLRIIKW